MINNSVISSGGVDVEIDEVSQKDIGQIYKKLERHETLLTGANGDNGLVGTLKKHEEELQEINEKVQIFRNDFQRYRFEERKNTCYGISAIKEYIGRKEEEEKMQLTREEFLAAQKKLRIDTRLQIMTIVVMPIITMILSYFLFGRPKP